MRWYQGGIAQAVGVSKNTSAIFVVFVEGQDEKSKQLAALINNEEVSAQLESTNFVAIKIEANSVPHQQFSQIYKEANKPSLVFIGKTGTPLEIIDEPQNPSEFMTKLAHLLESNGNKISGTTATEPKIATIQNVDVVCENNVCTLKSNNEPSTSKEISPDNADVEMADTEDAVSEEAVARAKELIMKKREAKQAEEEENERAKEIERRQMGMNVQKLKRWQEEQELKQVIEERDKEKKAEKAARDRVLAQIAQDKAERASKFAPQSPATSQPSTSPQPVRRVPQNTNISRLQFKLPDGSSHTHEFPSTNTLQDVRNYLRASRIVPFNKYSLSTTFPRRVFENNDDSQSLTDLELIPNAVLLVLPQNQGIVSNNSASINSLLWLIVSPFMNIFGYIRNWFLGTPPPRPPTTNQERKRPVDEDEQPSGSASKKRSGESIVQRHGNIHRLSDRTDSDDDNNTWNGNSTQQM